VKRVKDGPSVGVVAKDLELVEQTLRNLVKAAAAGGEHPAQARERNPKKRRRTSPRTRCEVRLNRCPARGLR